VFRTAQAAGSSSIHRQVSMLRKELGPQGALIKTTRGGYRLDGS
jgi:hypothetical protein